MRYNIVDNSKRKMLIEMVYGNDPITIREACAKLGIKLTTAKTILKIYRREGRISKLTFRQNKSEEALHYQEEQALLQSKEPQSSMPQPCRLPLDDSKEPEIRESQSSSCEARYQQLPGEPEGSLKIKLPEVPAQIEQFTPRELSNYLSSQVAEFTERVKQLDYISNSYRLLDKLHRVLKDSEGKIMAYQAHFRSHVLPAVMNEFLKRQGPMLQEFLSLPTCGARQCTEDEGTPSFQRAGDLEMLRDVRKCNDGFNLS